MNGPISPAALRALKSLSVNGPSSIDDLNRFDPENGDHKPIVKGLSARLLIVSDSSTKMPHERTRYSLSNKGRSALVPKAPTRTTHTKGQQRDANPPPPQTGAVAGPLVYGSLVTKRMTSPCADMLAPAIRSGAEQALQVPSRVNNQLHYRDGRVVHIAC